MSIFEWILIILGSLLFLYAAGYAFYMTFKKYKEDDDFNDPTLGLDTVQFIIDVLLFLSGKIASKKYHVVIFKTLSFLFALFLLAVVILLWVLLVYHHTFS